MRDVLLSSLKRGYARTGVFSHEPVQTLCIATTSSIASVAPPSVFSCSPQPLVRRSGRDERLNNKGRAKPWAGLRPGDDVRRSFARFRKCFPGVIARVGPEPQTTSLISSILLSRIAFLGLSGLLLCLFDHLSCGRCSDLPPSSCPEMTGSTAIAAAQSQYVVFSRQGLHIP